MVFPALHISVSIHRSVHDVYEFAFNPANLPKWAAGLSGSIRNVNGDWLAESPMGLVKVKFAARNEFGVLDHEVTLPNGAVVHNPMRVLPNNQGSELTFTLYHRPEMSAKEFAADAQAVETDLKKLKAILES